MQLYVIVPIKNEKSCNQRKNSGFYFTQIYVIIIIYVILKVEYLLQGGAYEKLYKNSKR